MRYSIINNPSDSLWTCGGLLYQDLELGEFEFATANNQSGTDLLERHEHAMIFESPSRILSADPMEQEADEDEDDLPQDTNEEDPDRESYKDADQEDMYYFI